MFTKDTPDKRLLPKTYKEYNNKIAYNKITYKEYNNKKKMGQGP